MFKRPQKLIGSFSGFEAEQKKFLRNALIAFFIWFLVADLNAIHDFLIKSLAQNTIDLIGWISGQSPNLTAPSLDSVGNCIIGVFDSRGGIQIGSPCDGWELYYLSAGFILIFPGFNWRRKLWYSIFGILGMYITNVLRIMALFFLAKSHPDWFQLYHHTIFQFIVYVIMFVIWMLYLRGNKIASE